VRVLICALCVLLLKRTRLLAHEIFLWKI